MISLLACLLQGPGAAIDVAEYLRAHAAGDAALVRGDSEEARRRFERCLELDEENPTVAYALACVEARAGQVESGLEWLERAGSWGYRDAALVEWDADLEALRGTDRYGAVLSAMRAAGSPPSGQTKIVAIASRTERPGMPHAIALDDQGRYVLVGDTRGALVLLDAATGRRVRDLGTLPAPVWEVAFHPDGERAAALAYDGRAYVFRTDGDEPRQTLPSALEELPKYVPDWGFGACLRFDPSGERLLVGARNLGASLWTVDGQLLRSWATPYGSMFSVRLAWSADGRIIAEPDGDGIHFRSGVTGEPLERTFTPTPSTRAVALHPDGRRIATGHEDGRVRVWDMEDGKLLYAARVRDTFEVPNVDYVCFSPNGELLAATTVHGADLSVFETESGAPVFEGAYLGGRMGEQAHVSWSPDGARAWFAFTSGALWLHGVALEEGARPEQSDFHDAQGPFGPEFALGRYALGRARPPRVGRAGTAAFIRRWGVVGLDTRSGNPTWHRPWVGRDREIVQAPAGYFSTQATEIEDLVVLRGSDDKEPLPLPPLATRLFDPKRVRAARDGVPLLPLGL